ncbi:MAG: BtpA/SgcQ family protein [Alphaproteobacteria bacterium]|nr:BtpA/SgcQ family protein [Alphaproteobacteria bacterium]
MIRRRVGDERPALVGVVHLLPLPGAPRPGPPLDVVLARAVADARALQAGGADAVIVENLGDAPFAADVVDPVTVAAMTVAVAAVRDAVTLPVGVNVLRNDALAALGIAHVTGAAFVRVNVLTGVMATDQGLITGQARALLQQRRLLGSDVRVAADVLVKHAVPLGPMALDDVAHDTWARGGADALIVTGTGTGRPTRPDDVATVRRAVPEAPIWLGSGLTPERADAVRDLVDGAIVGTWLHEDADLARPLDPARVRALRAVW